MRKISNIKLLFSFIRVFHLDVAKVNEKYNEAILLFEKTIIRFLADGFALSLK